jgi:hypothetical protein
MCEWFKKLLADKDGNPNEHIIAALWGSFGLIVLTVYLIYSNHPPTLLEYAGGHGTIWTGAGAAQRLARDS